MVSGQAADWETTGKKWRRRQVSKKERRERVSNAVPMANKVNEKKVDMVATESMRLRKEEQGKE